MPAMWVSNLTLSKVGQRIRAVVKVVTVGGVPVPGAVVTVKLARLIDSGVYADYTADLNGNISVDTPVSWVLSASNTYKVKICRVEAAGFTWDNTQGFCTRRVTL